MTSWKNENYPVKEEALIEELVEDVQEDVLQQDFSFLTPMGTAKMDRFS